MQSRKGIRYSARGAILLVVTTLVMLIAGDVAAKAKTSRKLRGKIFFAAKILDRGPAAVQRLFKDSKPKATLKREKGKDGHWVTVMAAFFRKKSYAGPMTLWFFDKTDKAALRAKQAMHVMSVNSSGPSTVFVYDLDISPNDGFNKGRAYIVRVGQIIGKRSRIYASGEVNLKP